MSEAEELNADERADTLFRSEAIEDSLMNLSVDYRTVIILRHFLELNQAEMAQILELPEKTVKSRLFSARQRLATLLGADAGEGTNGQRTAKT
mgnify:CR=1 FL=1